MIDTEHPQWLGDKATKGTIHNWLNYHFPRKRICSKCHKKGKTDWAFLKHPDSYTRKIEDYAELCRKCHMHMDKIPQIQPRTHCKKGHEYTLSNVYVWKN